MRSEENNREMEQDRNKRATSKRILTQSEGSKFYQENEEKNSSETNEKFNWNVIKSFPDFQYYNLYLPELKELLICYKIKLFRF